MAEELFRLSGLPPYVFAEVNAMKAAARRRGEDVIDLGMGNPDGPPPPHVVQKLVETLNNPRVHGYSTSRGIPGLRRALAGYYQRRFNVALDPENEVVVTLGSKEGLANLAQAIVAPGDVVVAPDPCYPIHAFGQIFAGATLRSVPIGAGIDLFAGLERAMRQEPRPRCVVVNFPANPTALTVGLDFYHRLIKLALELDITVVSDVAYAEIYFDGNPPPSILQVPGAKEIAIEFSSLSKSYNMAGWRIGFAAGNPRMVAALAKIKSYLDYGAFTPIQVAATAALNQCEAFVVENRTRYRERRDVLVEGLQGIGWPVPAPPATMFVWAPIPAPYRGLGSLEFSKLLLREAMVAVSPGLGFGEYGEGFVRFALVENRQRTRQAVRNIKTFLGRSAPDRSRAVA
ncbi:MAG TPA: aminotransferase class I/II-fold pyridoxal phosphate-dependent enzyme [Dongiaceae bacterium]|nr:aminotransferase class I/II-fold pyridoxal phosphate-dependent enzyme [Dongiaceae bacterium]